MIEIGNIEISEFEDGTHIVKNTHNSKYVKMGKRETDFLVSLLTFTELGSDNNQSDSSLTLEEKNYLIERFKEWGFLESNNNNVEKESKFKKFTNYITNNITHIKIFTLEVDKLLNKISAFTRIAYSRIALCVYAGLFILAWILINNNVSAFINLKTNDFSVIQVVLLYMMFFLTTVFHEFCHAATCNFFGGKVKKMGIMLFYLLPVAYTDVSDVYLIKSKKKKALVSLAGIIGQLVLANIATIIYFTLAAFDIKIKLLIYYVLVNIGTAIYNLIPFVKFDGYWVLSQLLGITNLRDKSFGYVFDVLIRRNNSVQKYSKFERNVLLTYGISAMLFTAAFWIYSIIILNDLFSFLIGDKGFYLTLVIASVLLMNYFRLILKSIQKICNNEVQIHT